MAFSAGLTSLTAVVLYLIGLGSSTIPVEYRYQLIVLDKASTGIEESS